MMNFLKSAKSQAKKTSPSKGYKKVASAKDDGIVYKLSPRLELAYTIVRSSRQTLAVQIKEDGKIVVRSPQRCSMKTIEGFLLDNYSKIIEARDAAIKRASDKIQITPQMREEGNREAKRIIPILVEYYAKMMGVTYGRITIREQKTRWGSCSSKGNLNFNWKIVMMPREVLEYVVVHELAHRIEMNHSPAFWQIVENVLPDYKERRKALKNANQ